MDTQVENSISLHWVNGNPLVFIPTHNGLYCYTLSNEETINSIWAMISMVEGNADKYTKHDYCRAIEACRFQNVIMWPGDQELMDTSIQHLKDCLITQQDIMAATDIFGPNLGSLKGKTVHRPNPHVKTGTPGVPMEILSIHHDIMLAIDIMFINKIPFLVMVSRNLKFGMVEALNSQQIPTIINKLKSIIKLYEHCGFWVMVILADPEFEPLHPWFPMLNCCGADEHIPDVEQYIQTLKDRTRSTYQSLPYKYIPRIILIHLVKNVALWLNTFPSHDGISSAHSPHHFMTGFELSFKLHARIEFGPYVQTHEEHTNDMSQ